MTPEETCPYCRGTGKHPPKLSGHSWDVAEAFKLRDEDPRKWTYQALADRYGVTTMSVYFAFFPEKRK